MPASATTVLAAARAGDERSVRRALKHDAAAVGDWRLLMDAAFHGHVDVVETLLAFGADPNVLSKSAGRYRPLHRVAEYRISAPKTERHERIVRLLLDAGADPAARATRAMMTPALLASIAGNRVMVDLFLRRTPRRDIFTAAAVGDVGRVRSLLKREPHLARAEDATRTALWHAAASRLHAQDRRTAAGVLGAARALLDAGADPNTAGRGVPALYYAIGHAGNEPLAALLIERGADPDRGGSLVHASCAVHFAHLEAGIAWMHAHGANPNIRYGPERQTPLHKAALLGYVGALTALLKLGADATLRDAAGRTPLDVAREERKPRAIAALSSPRAPRRPLPRSVC